MKYEEMENVLNGLISGIASENLDKAKKVLSEKDIRKVADAIIGGDLDEIDCVVFSGFRYTIQDLCSSMGLNSEAAFLVEHYGFIEISFNKIYSKYDGMACCSDKSRTVVLRLFNFLRDGKRIEFNPDAEYTYHHPKNVLSDHDSIVGFFTALRNMYYGSPQQYLDCLVDINKSAKKNKDVSHDN